MGEIFAYGSVVIAMIIIWFMPKHLTRREIYITWGFMAALTVYTDLVFGLVFDLYDFFSSPKVDLVDLPLQALLAPSMAIIILNFMPKGKANFVVYIFGVVLFACCFEWLSLQTGYLVYKGWRLCYSPPFFVSGMIFLRWHLHYLRK